MKKQILKSPGGLWYSHWIPEIAHALNRTVIVCLGGSGEHGSYSAVDMQAEVSRVTEKNGFAQDAANGEELPFQIISPLATKGKDIADHRLIASEISSIASSLDVDYRFLGGLSFGGQTTAGFFFQSRNGTELANNLPSSFKNPNVFDGFFMLCGQVPSDPDECASPTKRIFIAHAIGDTAIPVGRSFDMMKMANDCTLRTEKVYSNYYRKWEGSTPIYLPIQVPPEAKNFLFIIPDGNHGTAWNETYNWSAPQGRAGYAFRKWVESIALPKETQKIPGEVYKDGSGVFCKFTDGTVVQLSTV
jgi:hypothetical protein